jgi:phosphatidylglycerol:prolipoprotein diacylglycerol transferase
MIAYPSINPVIFSVGPFQIRWYGLMYVLGFTATYLLVKKQIAAFEFKKLEDYFENLNLVLILCVILGGRLGYVLFYNFSYYLAHPMQIPATWNGGMSFHGACLALILGGVVYCRMKKIDFWKTADIYVVTVPIGLGLGRLGNFINGELYGRVTSLPWGMIFPNAPLFSTSKPWVKEMAHKVGIQIPNGAIGINLPRHPSQLYEAFLEGFVLFTILWLLRKKPWENKPSWPHGSMLALFLIFYGIFRILVEFVRQPDPQVGFLFGGITEGQLLSSFMVIGGFILWWFLKAKKSRT